MSFGVYLHVPFCRHRCDYCAFATWTDRQHLQEAYVAACKSELLATGLPVATSAFVGGGTPSVLPGPLLASLLEAVPRAPDAEVTVECNPEDASAELFDCWRDSGVTRVSVGVQSMVPHVLLSLGRVAQPSPQYPETVSRAVELVVAAGFPTFNLDLIYGAAGESIEDWRSTLDGVAALGAPHVSAYALSLEPGTPLAGDRSRHPNDDDQAAKYALAEEVLGGAGLGWYEISNWARPGHECAHNLAYWSQGEYRGIGCGAHSHVRGKRWWNVRTPERYIAAVRAGHSPVAGEDVLDEEGRRLERLQLALRTRGGVPPAHLPEALLPDGDLSGLVECQEERAVLTLSGRLLANEVALRLRP